MYVDTLNRTEHNLLDKILFDIYNKHNYKRILVKTEKLNREHKYHEPYLQKKCFGLVFLNKEEEKSDVK